jgi:hypothetical protein
MSRLADLGLFVQDQEFKPSHTREEVTRATSADPELDWPLVVTLRRKASELITQASAATNPLSDADRRLLGRSIIRRVVRDYAETLSATGEALWPVEVEYACAQAVENAVFGYGRLQPLFEIPNAENIEIHGYDSVVVQFGDGHRESRPSVADSDDELVEAIRFLGESVSPARPFDDTHPMLTLGCLRIWVTSSDAGDPAVLPLQTGSASPRSWRYPQRLSRPGNRESQLSSLTKNFISTSVVRRVARDLVCNSWRTNTGSSLDYRLLATSRA